MLIYWHPHATGDGYICWVLQMWPLCWSLPIDPCKLLHLNKHGVQVFSHPLITGQRQGTMLNKGTLSWPHRMAVVTTTPGFLQMTNCTDARSHSNSRYANQPLTGFCKFLQPNGNAHTLPLSKYQQKSVLGMYTHKKKIDKLKNYNCIEK